jgi:hypothetical protein
MPEAGQPLEQCAMKRGDLEALHNEQLANGRLSDAEFKRTLVREGLGRAFDLIDELTRPAGKTNGHTPAANDNDTRNGGAASRCKAVFEQTVAALPRVAALPQTNK